MIRIIGLDPGLRHTGWGVIEKNGNSYAFIGAGVINPQLDKTLSERLAQLHSDLEDILKQMNPDEASIEEVFVNKNSASTLKLGEARGVVLCAPALMKIPTFEYAPNQIKKTIVGVGHAQKNQVDLMIRTVLKNIPNKIPPDASDALAIALCHGFMR